MYCSSNLLLGSIPRSGPRDNRPIKLDQGAQLSPALALQKLPYPCVIDLVSHEISKVEVLSQLDLKWNGKEQVQLLVQHEIELWELTRFDHQAVRPPHPAQAGVGNRIPCRGSRDNHHPA